MGWRPSPCFCCGRLRSHRFGAAGEGEWCAALLHVANGDFHLSTSVARSPPNGVLVPSGKARSASSSVLAPFVAMPFAPSSFGG